MHKVLSKGALNVKDYKIASCAEIAGYNFHQWINMTCEKVAINGPNLKKLAPKKSDWQKWWQKKTNPRVNPVHAFIPFALCVPLSVSLSQNGKLPGSICDWLSSWRWVRNSNRYHRSADPLSYLYPSRIHDMSRNTTKPTNWLCAQRRLRSAWASTQSDQTLPCQHE